MFTQNKFWYVTLVLVLAVIVGTSWWGLKLIESSTREEAGEIITTVLESTRQALESWMDGQMATARVWARSKEVLRLSEALLRVPRNTEALVNSRAQQELREHLGPVLEANSYEGFFLVAPDNINLGSTRDNNLGVFNLLSTQPEILQRIRQGKTLFSLPQFSDVSLPGVDGRLSEKIATMFVGAPVRNSERKIITILLFRINPAQDFSIILRQGRVGESGETYAFNQDGLLISESRFENQLEAIGLLPPGQDSMLNIQIRDPGFNLLENRNGSRPDMPLPLTRMARSAVMGEAGLDLDGYRDYRGVKVVGAWAWDSKSNYGITTEIDHDQIYQKLNFIRSTFLALTILSIVIVMGLVFGFIWTRRTILESELRYRGLIEGATQGIVLHRDDKPILANHAFAEQFGYENPEDILGLPSLSTLLPLQGDSSGSAPIHEGRFEIESKKIDGTPIQLELFQRKIQWKGGDAIQSITVDITERILLERKLRQSQKMEAIGELVGGIAHDFNNMLHVIRGYAEIVEAGLRDNPKLESSQGKVIQAAESASQLTRRLLAFSRQDILQMKDVNMQVLVSNQVQMLERIIGEDIELSLNFTEKNPIVHADPVMMEQVLLNLCVNSRDAMPEGGKLIIKSETIHVDEDFQRLNQWSKPGPYLVLSVTDTGVGMNKEVQEHIFEPFYTTKEVGKGTGLGLSTVWGILEQHGGMTDVHSEPGVGTTFKVYLPLVAETTQVEILDDESEPPIGGNETILIAEDDEIVGQLLSEILSSEGYRVHWARDGEEAIDLYHQHQKDIHLAMIDMVMPKLNGRAVYNRIQSLSPNVPVIFSTGYTADVIDQDFIEKNRITVIHKPYSTASLTRVIRKILDRVPEAPSTSRP